MRVRGSPEGLPSEFTSPAERFPIHLLRPLQDLKLVDRAKEISRRR